MMVYGKTDKTFRLDPRTKIFLVLTISTILASGGVLGYMAYVRLILSFIPIFLFAIDGKIKTFVKFTLVYIALFLINIYLRGKTTGIINFLLGGWIGIFNHFLPGFIMAYYMFSSTKISEFITAMEKVKMPKSIIVPFSVIFRMFPTMKAEYSAIKNAVKMRAISWRKGPSKMIEYRIVPFIVSTVRIGDELTAASLTRGIDNPVKRTNICELEITWRDLVFVVICLISWVLYFMDKVM